MLTPPAEPYLYHMLLNNGQWVEAASGRCYRRESPAHDVAVGSPYLTPQRDVSDFLKNISLPL